MSPPERMARSFLLLLTLVALGGCDSSGPTGGEEVGEGEQLEDPNACEVGCGSWATGTPMPTPRSVVGTAEVNQRIYVFGGQGAEANEISVVEIYDPLTDSWSTGATMPTARNEMATAVVDGKIFLLGGCCPPLDTNERYDPATDTWTTWASMPRARHGPQAGLLGGKIYVVGGQTGDNSLSWVDVYDPGTNSWTSAADLNRPRTDGEVAVVAGVLYAIGGEQPQPQGGVTHVERYDPQTDTWVDLAPMRFIRGMVAIGVIDGKIYATGPAAEGGSQAFPPNATEVYDPATDSWTRLADAPAFRHGLKGAAAGGRLYLFGGRDENDQLLDLVDVFTPGG